MLEKASFLVVGNDPALVGNLHLDRVVSVLADRLLPPLHRAVAESLLSVLDLRLHGDRRVVRVLQCVIEYSMEDLRKPLLVEADA